MSCQDRAEKNVAFYRRNVRYAFKEMVRLYRKGDCRWALSYAADVMREAEGLYASMEAAGYPNVPHLVRTRPEDRWRGEFVEVGHWRAGVITRLRVERLARQVFERCSRGVMLPDPRAGQRPLL